MKMRMLGRTGMEVSPLCLGAMMFGAFGNRDHDECVGIVHAALDAGINFVDTADVYSAGESEEIVAKALKGRRDDVILATKCHFPVDAGPFEPHPPANSWGNSRRHIVKACEDSLRRLGTDWIDLYQIHRPDPRTDIDETLGALSDLVRAGKVRAVGCSTFPPDQLVEAHWTAERRGHVRFATEQPPYSIFVRWIERDLLPTTQRHGMGTLVWSPLNGGWLSGTYRAGGAARTEGRAARMPARFDPAVPSNARKLELVEELVKLADEAGMPLADLALAWTLVHPGVTSTIIGPRTMDHLVPLLPAAERTLSAEVLDRIDALVAPGTNVEQGEAMYLAPWLRTGAPARRR
jgi:aryl-alcohol dehydrogenase-like predicted oxidoreductase